MGESFSFVSAQGTQFWLNGAPFFAGGVNCYFLAYCSDVSRRAAMANAKSMGASVIRAWAFLAVDDFAPGQVAFQYCRDGQICVNDGPDGLHRLDALIHAAEDLGLKLILPLTNYWADFGGAPAYVKWLAPGAADVTEFYRSPALRLAYRDWVRTILTRRNTVTGRLYPDEPAIMAWELMNEAREMPLDWVSEMAAFAKGLDPNHLLAVGDEAARAMEVPEIDFGTFHFYPEAWGKRPSFGRRWIRQHSRAAAALNKPVIFEEFGVKQNRDYWHARWMQAVRENGTAGALVWMLGHRAQDTGGYVDDFVIY
jgi:mannan endo-1,4-beta-mannosidase